MSCIDIFSMDWSSLPLDLITSIVPYLSPRDVLSLCIRNDSFNRRVCQDQNSIVWKLLYQRDISSHIPSHNIVGHYLDIMDEILPLPLNDRLIYGAKSGYEEMVKNALNEGANIHAHEDDDALHYAAVYGNTETVKLLLDRGADIHTDYDLALRWAALHGHTETVKLLLDRGAAIHAHEDDALYLAALYGNTETVKLLLAYGATITPDIRRIAGQSRNPEIRTLLKLT